MANETIFKAHIFTKSDIETIRKLCDKYNFSVSELEKFCDVDDGSLQMLMDKIITGEKERVVINIEYWYRIKELIILDEKIKHKRKERCKQKSKARGRRI